MDSGIYLRKKSASSAFFGTMQMKDNAHHPVGKWSYGRRACGEFEIDGEKIAVYKTRFGERALFGEGTMRGEVVVLRFSGIFAEEEEELSGPCGTPQGGKLSYSPEKDGGGYCAAGGDGLAGEIAIASSHSGGRVVSIAERAFEGCVSVTGIAIPEGVTKIGERAFFECRSLKRVNLPAGIGRIPGHAFFGCSALEEIDVPEGVAEIGNHAFGFCRSLRRIRLPESLKRIGHGAFWGCDALEEVSIADMGGWCAVCFDGIDANPLFCSPSLIVGGARKTSLAIPEGTPEIGAYAFAGCALEQVFVPPSVKKIGAYAFDGCKGLHSIVYGGTCAAWFSVEKEYWADGTGDLKIVCMDGTIDKNGTLKRKPEP